MSTHKPPIDRFNDRDAWAFAKCVSPKGRFRHVLMPRVAQGEGRNGAKRARKEEVESRKYRGGHETRQYRASQAWWDRMASDIARQANIKLPPDARTRRGMRCFDRTHWWFL